MAIATDFWLYTTEFLDPGNIPEISDSAAAAAAAAASAASGHGTNDTRNMPPPPPPPPVAGGTKGAGGEAGSELTIPLIARYHSGLWRSCAFDDPGRPCSNTAIVLLSNCFVAIPFPCVADLSHCFIARFYSVAFVLLMLFC